MDMEGHNLNGHHGSGNGYQCILDDDRMSINSSGPKLPYLIRFDTPSIVGEWKVGRNKNMETCSSFPFAIMVGGYFMGIFYSAFGY